MSVRYSYRLKMKDSQHDASINKLAQAFALLSVRNTFLEDLHAGKFPVSLSGDYSDIKVMTPNGEIPWNDISRLNDEEMKKLMKQVVNKLYTCLHAMISGKEKQQFDHLISTALKHVNEWDEADFDSVILNIKRTPKD